MIRALLFANLLFAAAAQTLFDDSYKAAAAQNPAGVRFEVSVVGGRTTFHMGERIPLSLCFSSDRENVFSADTSPGAERQDYFEEIHAAPESQVEDPLGGTIRGGFHGSISSAELSNVPYCLARDLNAYVRFLKPGQYRFYAVSYGVVPVERRKGNWLGPRVRPAVVSNLLSLTIVPAPPGWTAARLKELTAVLEDPDASAPRREAAERDLRYLDTYEAALAMFRYFAVRPSVQLHLGMMSSRYRARILPVLEQRLTAPDQPVHDAYMRALMDLWRVSALPPWPPYGANPTAEQQKQAVDEGQRRMMRENSQLGVYLSRLAAAVARKTPSARPRTLETLLRYARMGGAEPSWEPDVAATAAREFTSFDAGAQSWLLSYAWREIRKPELLPILERLYTASPLRSMTSDLLIDRIRELDPARGRALILAELRAKPPRKLSIATLASLPDKELPDIEEILADYADGPLIVRYAGPRIYPRVRAAYEKGRNQVQTQSAWTCLSPLHYYFLRVDPDYGKQEVQRQLDHPDKAPPICIDLAASMRDLGPWAASPALEEVAIQYLTSPVVLIKQGAAEVLGKYGSLRAKQPLWDTFAYWHNWWKDRKNELEPVKAGYGWESVQFERALRTALAQASAWVLTPDEWQRLASYCVTDSCKSEVTQWRRQAAQLEVRVTDPAAWRSFGAIGLYQAATEQAFLEKIRQYPAGTVFRWSRAMAPFAEDQAAYSRWQQRFAELGMRLER